MSKFPLFSWSQHLYVRIYAAVLLSLATVILLFFTLLNFYPELGQQQTQQSQNFDGLLDFGTEMLPPISATAETQQAAMNHRRLRRYRGVALYSAKGEKIAAIGAPLPAPDLTQSANGWLKGRPPVMAIQLADGRWLLGERHMPGNRPPRINMQLWLALLVIGLGVGAYPVVRRITRRLERLQSSVEALGDGQLSTRVAIVGEDEVARLAASFNRSASRIEALMTAQKNLLANASHELRSPLARIRMAVELMESAPSPAMRLELVRNIAELDQLVDEILLASRLDGSGAALVLTEQVDLTALLAEECARVDAELDAPDLQIIGDARLLRRMLRNLLENAQRYGEASPITVRLSQNPEWLVIDVCDAGRGVPEMEREKIFNPFYRLPGARERDGGVGLGLSLVRQIARAHHGEVICLPRAEKGSCFRVSLPKSVIQ